MTITLTLIELGAIANIVTCVCMVGLFITAMVKN